MTAMIMSLADLRTLLRRRLAGAGMPELHADLLAATILAGERDGTGSHGLNRLAGYLDSLACGWVNPQPKSYVEDIAPGLLRVDADNGFAQIALALASSALTGRAHATGMASLAIANAHHFAALWPDVEPFAQAGFIALSMVNSRNRIVVWDARSSVLGTNPMAFACPRRDGPPIVWDQASSVMSQGEVLRHATAGEALPPGIAVDRAGNPTTDAHAALDSGALLAFGGAKGGSIAFMVEVLAAALTGGRFGFEDNAAHYPGAQTSNAGQFLLLIDPVRMAGTAFLDRIESLVAELRNAGATRLPGERRYRRRAETERDGVDVPPAILVRLTEVTP